MPVQTTKTENIYFPDGAKVSVKAAGDVTYTDLGAIGSDVTATLNWDENQFETANAGKLSKQIKNMTIDGGLTLINLNQEGIEKMSGGIMTKVATAGTAVSTIPVQDIAGPWEENAIYDLVMLTSSSDSTKLRMATKPVLTSIVLDPTDVNEALTENSDYIVLENSNSYSGWSVVFIADKIVPTGATALPIGITYGTNTPVASSTLYAGSSTVVIDAYSMLVEHTDSDGKKRSLELFSIDPNSGGMQFNFKAATSDGVEEMPLTFTGKLDTSKTDGRQLMAWTVDTGAA